MKLQKIKSDEEKSKKIDFLIKLGFNKEEAEKNRLKVSSPNSYLYWMYNGLSKEAAIEKVSEIQRTKSPRCKEYWIKRGYNEKDAILEVSKYQDKVSLDYTIKNGGSPIDYELKCSNRKINKDKYISLYGEEEGIKRWNDKKDKSKITLDNMIRVYGEEEGIKRWSLYIDKQKYRHSYEGLVENHGEKKAMEIYNFRKNLNQLRINRFLETQDYKFLNNSFSKSSQDLFWRLYNILPTELREKCYFKELNHEFTIVLENDNGDSLCYLYDFVISDIKLCIEFNGDIWHANPKVYNSDDIIFGKKAEIIWNRDREKIRILKEKRNIDTIVVWESEYKSNKIEVIKEIVEKILNIYDNNIRKSIN